MAQRPTLSASDTLMELGLRKFEIDGRKQTIINNVKEIAKDPATLKKLAENPQKFAEKLEAEAGLTISRAGLVELSKLKDVVELGDSAAINRTINQLDEFIAVASDSSSATASATSSATASGI